VGTYPGHTRQGVKLIQCIADAPGVTVSEKNAPPSSAGRPIPFFSLIVCLLLSAGFFMGTVAAAMLL
jgi:hypothetical protein